MVPCPLPIPQIGWVLVYLPPIVGFQTTVPGVPFRLGLLFFAITWLLSAIFALACEPLATALGSELRLFVLGEVLPPPTLPLNSYFSLLSQLGLVGLFKCRVDVDTFWSL